MSNHPICDYEGSRYRTEFWTAARDYEDGAERVALRALLPPSGRTLVEIGAGFGRLGALYQGYETVVFMDYARTQLEQAVAQWGEGGADGEPRYRYVQADFYALPFVAGLFDAVTMIRTLHHATDAPAVLRGISESLAPQGVLVLEFANKHNLKALGRYLLRRQEWSPFDREPVEFVELNFDFHPQWIGEQLRRLRLKREAVRTVSHFRAGFLKRRIPTPWLVKLDACLQPTGALWQWSPSVFLRARASRKKAPAAPEDFFLCPACKADLESTTLDEFHCPNCGNSWRKEGAIYNFRDPVRAKKRVSE